MISFALALVMAAAPAPGEGGSVAVLIVRRTSVSEAQARALAESVAALLEKAGVAVEAPAETLRRLGTLGVKDTTKCGGRKACALELLRQLEQPAGVTVSVSQLGSERSVALEAIRTRDGSLLAKEAVVLKKDEALDEHAVAALAKALVQDGSKPVAEVAPAPAPPPPTPVLTPQPQPVESPPPVVVLEPAPPPAKSHVGGIVLIAGAVVAAGVAAALSASAFSARGQVSQATNGLSPYSASQAQQFAVTANLQGGIAAGSAVLAVGLGVGAVIAW